MDDDHGRVVSFVDKSLEEYTQNKTTYLIGITNLFIEVYWKYIGKIRIEVVPPIFLKQHGSP